MQRDITSKTNITGLIGNPVEHSVSPVFQNRLCEIMNIDAVYLAFKANFGELESVVKALKSFQSGGFNVTIPYKTEIISFIDEINEDAKIIGAVNTVKLSGDRLIGYNTDGLGFIRALENDGIIVEGKSAVIFGAGGAARAAVSKLAQNNTKKITILNRTPEKAKELQALVKSINENCQCIAAQINDEKIKEYSNDCELLINTTSLGMWPNVIQSPVLSNEIFGNKPYVFDMIFNPISTRFLNMAKESSCKTQNGLAMLVYQGIASFELWHDCKVPTEEAKNLIALLKEYFE